MTVTTTTTHTLTVVRGDRVPPRGHALRGSLLYIDGRLVGALHTTKANAAHQIVLDVRGEYIELRYRPWDEIRTEILGGSK